MRWSLRLTLIAANLLVPMGGAIHELRAQAVSSLYPINISDVLQYAAPSSGATVVASQGTTALVLDNGSLLATLTVTLPASPTDGQRILIASGAGVTLLTVNGGTVKGIISTLAVNGYVRYIYSTTSGAWFRTG